MVSSLCTGKFEGKNFYKPSSTEEHILETLEFKKYKNHLRNPGCSDILRVAIDNALYSQSLNPHNWSMTNPQIRFINPVPESELITIATELTETPYGFFVYQLMTKGGWYNSENQEDKLTSLRAEIIKSEKRGPIKKE
ncbi:MAG: hypothetical protein KAQ83_01205, partial [Nanoarchaeota archaeon]|nr:hypothetical protein [Nanoarchaeota archaeon]